MANLIDINAIFKLRRDNDYNYAKIENTFIPKNGEVCLIDTARNGLRAKIGDGINIFKNLKFVDEDISINIIVKGYLKENVFYYEADYTNIIPASINKIYVDIAKNIVYLFNGTDYISITQSISAASSSTAGILKLYNTIGYNEDGTMTQKAITEELNDKIEARILENEELLLFYID